MDEYITRRANKEWICVDCGKHIAKGSTHIEHRTPATSRYRAGERLCLRCVEDRAAGDEPLGADEEILEELRSWLLTG